MTWMTRICVLAACIGLIRISHIVYAQDPIDVPHSDLVPDAAGLPGTATEAPRPPEPSPSERFDRLDGDKDGFVSRAEAASDPQVLRVFDALDISGDGRLDLAEYTELSIEPVLDTPSPR